MKKFLSIMIMSLTFVSVSAQENVNANKQFIKRFDNLVKRMNKYQGESEDSIALWKTERSKIQTLYKERYREQLSDDQIEEYSSLNAQYKSRMTEFRLGGLSEEIDSMGSRVSRGMRRAGKKVSGFLGGMKKQSDKNRTENK